MTLRLLSDAVIAFSYYSIAITLFYSMRRRWNHPCRWLFLIVGVFMIASGTTHVMEVLRGSHPADGVSDGINAVSAAWSVVTAISLIPLLPQALLLQSSRHMEEINQRLQKEETKFRGLLEAAPDAMIIVNETGKIVLLNAQAEKLFGYTREELLGNRTVMLAPERLHAQYPEYFSAYFKNPHARPMGAGLDLYARRKDGSEFAVEVSLSPMESEDGRLVTAAIRDATKRNQYDEELRHLRYQADESNRLKSEFLANMSHELRTPLNSIIGFSELIHDGKAGPIEPTQKEYLNDVLGSAHHLLQLINDILDLAKVEAGKIQLRPEKIALESFAKDVCGSMRTTAEEKKIELTVDIEPGLEPVQADPSRLKQMLDNYLSNALKFTPEGGKVNVRVQAEGKTYFRISVQDNGVGIAPENIQELFVAFQQLDASVAKKFQGTGLGLALTKKIAEAQGGHVGVDSAPGKGTVFYAVLPRNAGEIKVPYDVEKS